MKLQGKSILILPDSNPEKTKSGIFNPVTKELPNSGKVIDHGPGCELVNKGSLVQYKRKGASIVNLEEVEYHFIIEDQIVFIHG